MDYLHKLLSFSSLYSVPAFLGALALSAALFVLGFGLLHRMSSTVKKWVTIACTFIAGLYFLLGFIVPTNDKGENFITPTVEPVSYFIMYVFAWTLGLGIISLTIVHGRRLLTRHAGWHHSLAFFIAMLSFILFGFWSQIGASGPAGVKSAYSALFTLLINLDAAMFSLLAFYIASAAYRAFRVRTVEAGLLMVAALLVMLGLVNVGVWLTSWIPESSTWAFFRLENLSVWMMSIINMSGQRAVTIGVAVGALAMAMRLWLSLERGAFFSQEG
jgi:hypothetical protein